MSDKVKPRPGELEWTAYAILLNGALCIWQGQTWRSPQAAKTALREKCHKPGTVVRLSITYIGGDNE